MTEGAALAEVSVSPRVGETVSASVTDPFETLGIERRFKIDRAAVEQRHRDLSRALHPDKFAQASPAERRLAVEKSAAVNDAFRRVKNPQTRAAALLALAGKPLEENARAEPALLMEVMELREALEEVRGLKPEAREGKVQGLKDTVLAAVKREEDEIAKAFDGESPAKEAVDRAYAALVKLRYYYRFVEEADAMLDDDA